MKLADVKDKIDAYFDNITPEEFFQTLIKYHMRTSFKGTINGKDFDNVQDYNAEMQRLIALGEPISAHADTRSIEAPEDNSFLFPGFAQCTSINHLTDEFINAALNFNPKEFANDVNNLLHNRILPAIDKMPVKQLEQYAGMVDSILGYIEGLGKASDERAEQTINRLTEIEKELQDLKTEANAESDRKAVIDFVSSLYASIKKAIDARGNVAQVPEPITGTDCACPECRCETAAPGVEYLESIKTKARQLFGL